MGAYSVVSILIARLVLVSKYHVSNEPKYVVFSEYIMHTPCTCGRTCARGFICWMISFYHLMPDGVCYFHFHHCHLESQSRSLKVSLVASCFIVFHYIRDGTILRYHLLICEFIHCNIRQANFGVTKTSVRCTQLFSPFPTRTTCHSML